jgi:aryl-alcohol dehydrogenase
MKIKAAVVYEKLGAFKIEDVDLDNPREDEVLVHISGCGICRTDVAARDQREPVKLPAVFGHEGAGIVENTGTRVTKVKPGDHVVMSYRSCGICTSCKRGKPSYCLDFRKYNFGGARVDGSPTMQKNGQTINGVFFGQSSFASYALANEANVVKVDEDVPIEMLGPLGCGIQTGAGGVMNALRPNAGSSIAIFGAGSVGQSAILGAVVCGCTTIVAVDVIPERLSMAERFGATHIIDPGQEDPVEKIQEITCGGVEYSVECTGNPNVFRQAVGALTVTGVCGLIGVAALDSEVTLDMRSILRGRKLRGVVEGDSIPDIFIPRLIQLYKQGRFPFDRMVTFYPLDQINKAVEDADKGKVLKAVLRP